MTVHPLKAEGCRFLGKYVSNRCKRKRTKPLSGPQYKILASTYADAQMTTKCCSVYVVIFLKYATCSHTYTRHVHDKRMKKTGIKIKQTKLHLLKCFFFLLKCEWSCIWVKHYCLYFYESLIFSRSKLTMNLHANLSLCFSFCNNNCIDFSKEIRKDTYM